jgi:acid phosphatase (class A)
MEPMYLYASPRLIQEWQEDTKNTQQTVNTKDKQEAKESTSPKSEKLHANVLKTCILLLAIFSLTISNVTLLAQTSQQKSVTYKVISPDFDHYEAMRSIDATAKGGELEEISFPAKDFRRGAYLKMRTIYLNLPIESFKVSPYPANSSEQTRAELDFLLELQAKRTSNDAGKTDTMAVVYYDPFTINPADPDYTRNVNSLFYVGRSLGIWFTPEQLPVTSRVLQNVIQDATFYFFSLKAQFNRARPYHLEPRLQNLEAPEHASYPSGHSSASYVHAYLLSYMLPEHKDQLLSNAYDMAFSREIRGVHYPSDSEAGRQFAEQFVAELMKSKNFKADYAAMKAEINTVRNTNNFSKN